MSNVQTLSDFQLSESQRKQFVEDGYLGPLTMCSPEEMAVIRDEVDRVLATPPKSPQRHNAEHNRHLDSRVIYDLCTHPAILGGMTSLYGPDLLLWRAHFWNKGPGSSEIPWHQDFAYWPLEPAVIISAWIAIDESTVENACVQIIPGTHRKIVPHVTATAGMAFETMAQPGTFDPSLAINLEMKPGEFILFNERTLHHSEPNRSQKRRLGLASRVIPPMVNVLTYDSEDHGVMVIAGQDTMGFNRVVEPPVES
jgi:hypothetical protein